MRRQSHSPPLRRAHAIDLVADCGAVADRDCGPAGPSEAQTGTDLKTAMDVAFTKRLGTDFPGTNRPEGAKINIPPGRYRWRGFSDWRVSGANYPYLWVNGDGEGVEIFLDSNTNPTDILWRADGNINRLKLTNLIVRNGVPLGAALSAFNGESWLRTGGSILVMEDVDFHAPLFQKTIVDVNSQYVHVNRVNCWGGSGVSHGAFNLTAWSLAEFSNCFPNWDYGNYDTGEPGVFGGNNGPYFIRATAPFTRTFGAPNQGSLVVRNSSYDERYLAFVFAGAAGQPRIAHVRMECVHGLLYVADGTVAQIFNTDNVEMIGCFGEGRFNGRQYLADLYDVRSATLTACGYDDEGGASVPGVRTDSACKSLELVDCDDGLDLSQVHSNTEVIWRKTALRARWVRAAANVVQNRLAKRGAGGLVPMGAGDDGALADAAILRFDDALGTNRALAVEQRGQVIQLQKDAAAVSQDGAAYHAQGAGDVGRVSSVASGARVGWFEESSGGAAGTLVKVRYG